MKKLFLSISLACSLAASAAVGVTPRPAQMDFLSGAPFVIDSLTRISVSAPQPDSAHIAAYISHELPHVSFGQAPGHQISFSLQQPVDNNSEAYTLTSDNSGVTVSAHSGAGLFYGMQTLLQLISNNEVPAVNISDSPRFSYRGILLDVSRNFRSKEWVMKQLDAMARMKLNTLQFHLTDGAGWRLQIDRYPLLTSMAAWRVGKTWKDWNEHGNKYSHEGDSIASGGYYTKQDIRDILDHAASRYITVIPEIEMPSHSEEVLAAYPYLSCTGKPYTSSDFCPGNDSTFTFLENVLDEVIDLFPSYYIHIGGDEAPKTHWHDCPKCQARIKAENLKDVDELQSYLVHRIERYLNSKGRALIGWDEIMQGGLSPTASIVSWRGIDGGMQAAAQGNDAVMAPGKFCYFDGYQDAPYSQPEAIGGYLPIEMVYSFNPSPDEVPDSVASHIKGVEGTLFTEYIPTDEHAEFMLYPRTIALAEVGWTPQALRDYADFRPRAEKIAHDMKQHGYNVFDLATEIGNRSEAKAPVEHLALGKEVTYNTPWWENYPAAGAATLTDGLRGGWNYNDLRWQGFLTKGRERVDVTIDLGKKQPISFVGADFMQICGPDVWMPAEVVISISSDGKKFKELTRIHHDVVRDNEVTFKNFSWSGNAQARYVRYQALADHGILFTDEIVVR